MSTSEISFLLPLALVDGLNVCVLSITALLISLMFTFGLNRVRVLIMGSAFIAAVYVSYFVVGLGFLISISGFPTVPHIVARISAAIMLFIGVANIANYFYPGLVPIYNISSYFGRGAMHLIRRGSEQLTKIAALPALIGAGVLTGLHSFPCACTGGIYTLFLSTLSMQGDGLNLFYLFLYNTLFIIPATTILLVCTSKHVTMQVRKWLMSKHGSMKLWLGVIMVGAAVSILWGALTIH